MEVGQTVNLQILKGLSGLKTITTGIFALWNIYKTTSYLDCFDFSYCKIMLKISALH